MDSQLLTHLRKSWKDAYQSGTVTGKERDWSAKEMYENLNSEYKADS